MDKYSCVQTAILLDNGHLMKTGMCPVKSRRVTCGFKYDELWRNFEAWDVCLDHQWTLVITGGVILYQ